MNRPGKPTIAVVFMLFLFGCEKCYDCKVECTICSAIEPWNHTVVLEVCSEDYETLKQYKAAAEALPYQLVNPTCRTKNTQWLTDCGKRRDMKDTIRTLESIGWICD